jgi:hypothetical protein
MVSPEFIDVMVTGQAFSPVLLELIFYRPALIILICPDV